MNINVENLQFIKCRFETAPSNKGWPFAMDIHNVNLNVLMYDIEINNYLQMISDYYVMNCIYHLVHKTHKNWLIFLLLTTSVSEEGLLQISNLQAVRFGFCLLKTYERSRFCLSGISSILLRSFSLLMPYNLPRAWVVCCFFIFEYWNVC